MSVEAEKIEAERLWSEYKAKATEIQARTQGDWWPAHQEALSALVRSEVSRAVASVMLGIATHRDRWQAEAEAQDHDRQNGGMLTWQRAYAAQVLLDALSARSRAKEDVERG